MCSIAKVFRGGAAPATTVGSDCEGAISYGLLPVLKSAARLRAARVPANKPKSSHSQSLALLPSSDSLARLRPVRAMAVSVVMIYHVVLLSCAH